MKQVVLASSNLDKSVSYWKDLAGMTVFKETDKSVTLGYSETQAKLVLQDIGEEDFNVWLEVMVVRLVYEDLVLAPRQ